MPNIRDGLGWIHPWVGLGRIFQHMWWVGLGWVEWQVLSFFHCTLRLLQYYVLRKFANNASNANAVYWQSTRYSCFTEESWASVGLEFRVQWVGVFTATWQSVNHNQKPDVYYINGHAKIWVLHVEPIFLHVRWCNKHPVSGCDWLIVKLQWKLPPTVHEIRAQH